MNTQKQIITFLLHNTAYKLLYGSPKRSKIQQEAQTQYNQMRMQKTPDDIKGVDLIASILDSLIKQLVRCENTEELAKVVSYIEALEKGEVLIAAEIDKTAAT